MRLIAELEKFEKNREQMNCSIQHCEQAKERLETLINERTSSLLKEKNELVSCLIQLQFVVSLNYTFYFYSAIEID